ncbi:hypothetical protein LZ575_07320 [Antarcticibacterium sp. 1MA-6-2]|uniref:hypothetical protein n=1 Tax=Antarcticibacterium sp. 1MA-6-2 TaxID=2908210 RepID=UPI001F2F31FB|nr:hypothetical protein [Antarcticibacterium sp. 1MA-6-2]UJH92331.1 hypothetical protein LZ575_07320 [Antarcticibacterium sp. 1MA-6-2]
MIFSSLLAIFILCLTHVFVHKLRLSGLPRSKWLSIAGGISVSYIFLQSFPELREIQEKINHHEIFSIPGFREFEIYLISLLGLTFFYGLENRTKKSSESSREPDEGGNERIVGIFRIHIISFAFYNFIIGYLLLSREDTSMAGIMIYAIAMAFHFIVTDHSMEDHFRDNYKKSGRWILVLSLFLGWVTSLLFHIPEGYVGIIFAFLAGGIIMNVLKEELPKERESNLLAFCAGVIGYSVLLIFIL